MLTDEEKRLCLQIVRATIAHKLQLGPEHVECPSNEVFKQKYGLFVTLHKKGDLRGCIGYIQPYMPLYDSLRDLAVSAAFRDNRFPPLRKEEFDQIDIEISILSPLYLVSNTDEIEVGRDGISLQGRYGSGLLLPQVATQYGWDRDTFLAQTCRKAGVSEAALKDPQTKIFRFEAEIFGEQCIMHNA